MLAGAGAGLFARQRMMRWAGALLAAQVFLLGFVVLWQHAAFGPVDPPTTTDFVSFHAAGKLALAGTPALAYDRAAHAMAEAAATAPGIVYQYFFYPPVYLLLCAPLALLPYMAGFLTFQGVTMAAWLLVMRRILEARGLAWCVPVLAYPSVFWTLGLGQNAFLSAALLGGATVLLDTRPGVAGGLLGLLCYKPQLALLVPVALAAGGRWRSLGAAALTAAAMVGLSAMVFGFGTWGTFLASLSQAPALYESGAIRWSGFVTPYGGALLLGAGINGARLVQAAASVAGACAVGWIWRRDPGPEVRCASLAAGALFCAPLALVYDLLVLAAALGWLLRAGLRTGFLLGERATLLCCFCVPLVCLQFGEATHVPLGPLAPAAVLVLCVIRTARAPRRLAVETEIVAVTIV